MIGPDDVRQMVADLAAARGDAEEDIQLRRGKNVILAAQRVRITGQGSGRTAQGQGTQVAKARALVFGSPELDIAVGDRFTRAGQIYVVVFVQVERRYGTTAEAEVET